MEKLTAAPWVMGTARQEEALARCGYRCMCFLGSEAHAWRPRRAAIAHGSTLNARKGKTCFFRDTLARKHQSKSVFFPLKMTQRSTAKVTSTCGARDRRSPLPVTFSGISCQRWRVTSPPPRYYSRTEGAGPERQPRLS